MLRKLVCITVVALAATALMPRHVDAELLVNGDFEDLTGWGAIGDPVENAPAGWRDSPAGRFNPAAQQSGSNAIGGAGTSALLAADAGVAAADRKDFAQFLDQMTGPVYTFAFDFASEDPGESGNRSLSMSTRDGADNGLTFSFRINGDGDVQSFSGGWQTILPGAVVFDDDVSIDPLVHQFVLDVNTRTTPFYDLHVTDSDGVVHSATGLTSFRGTPLQGDGATGLEFNTFISSGDLLLDNVSLTAIPEPGTWILAGAMAVAVAFVRRGRTM